MKNLLPLFIFISIAACKTTKTITSTIPAQDSVAINVAVPDSSALDSARSVAGQLEKMKSNTIRFSTFSSRVKMDYEGGDKKYNDITAFVRIKKDSAVWVSLNAVLGIEAIRVFITPDSVKVMDKLNKTYQQREFNFLREVTKLPVDFKILEDLLMGNPVFLEDSVAEVSNKENVFQLITMGDVFKNITEFIQPEMLISKTLLQHQDSSVSRSAQLDYAGYESNGERKFSTIRKIAVMDQKPLHVNLEFKQVVFDNQVNFPFAIPGNYKLK